MKVFVLQGGCVDMAGDDRFESVHYTYTSAMSKAKRLAATLMREYEEDGNPGGKYDVEYWYGDEDDDNCSVGHVYVYRGDPEAPDYWWYVDEAIVES